MELHSRYLTAPHFLTHFLPLAVLTQSFVMSTTEWRKSVCVPTMKKGVSGLNCLISGIHFNFTFSNESLSYTEKQTTNTSVSEYASVRRRSYVSCKRNQFKINKNVLHIFFFKRKRVLLICYGKSTTNSHLSAVWDYRLFLIRRLQCWIILPCLPVQLCPAHSADACSLLP